MLLLEFEENIKYGLNIVKYRELESDEWYYIYLDIETLNTMIRNYGIISTKRIPTKNISVDNPNTDKHIEIKYSGAKVNLYCGNKTYIYLPVMEQNY